MNSCSSMLDPEPYVGLQVWRAVNSCSSMLDPEPCEGLHVSWVVKSCIICFLHVVMHMLV